MPNQRWDKFAAELFADHKARRFSFLDSSSRFRTFVESIPEDERIPLLLETYGCYRSLGATCASGEPKDYFWTSANSILISTLLGFIPKVTEAEACSILRSAFHYCGHGGDVEPPVTLAEKAFAGERYTVELFDAVRAYQAALKGIRSVVANNVKRRLQWILWHDSRKIIRTCWMGRVQRSLAAMPDDRRFVWEWLLRNTSGSANGAPGETWLKEAEKRIAMIDHVEFLAFLDEWLVFPAGETIALSTTGSCVLRLLVWYAGLVDLQKSLPILVRLADVRWCQKEPARKVIGGLSWLLRVRGTEAYRPIAESIVSEWDSGEMIRLREAYGLGIAAPHQPATRESQFFNSPGWLEYVRQNPEG